MADLRLQAEQQGQRGTCWKGACLFQQWSSSQAAVVRRAAADQHKAPGLTNCGGVGDEPSELQAHLAQIEG